MDDFTTIVREMRQAQKAYFKSRLHSDLVKCKDLERRVDQALAEMEAKPEQGGVEKQIGLFPGELR